MSNESEDFIEDYEKGQEQVRLQNVALIRSKFEGALR